MCQRPRCCRLLVSLVHSPIFRLLGKGRVLNDYHISVSVYMDFYGIGCLDARCLFSLFYLLIYFVGSRKSVRTRLFNAPYKYICYRGAGRYICPNGIYIQVLQFLCQITADCLRPCFNRFFAVVSMCNRTLQSSSRNFQYRWYHVIVTGLFLFRVPCAYQ